MKCESLSDLVDRSTDARLTKAVLVVSARPAPSLARRPDLLLVQTVGHRQTLTETPAERRRHRLVAVSTRLHTEIHPLNDRAAATGL